jgi:hypothetical protein
MPNRKTDISQNLTATGAHIFCSLIYSIIHKCGIQASSRQTLIYVKMKYCGAAGFTWSIFAGWMQPSGYLLV